MIRLTNAGGEPAVPNIDDYLEPGSVVLIHGQGGSAAQRLRYDGPFHTAAGGILTAEEVAAAPNVWHLYSPPR